MEKLTALINERLSFARPIIDTRQSQHKLTTEEINQLNLFLKFEDDCKKSLELIESIKDEKIPFEGKRMAVKRLDEIISIHLKEIHKRCKSDLDFYEVFAYREPDNINFVEGFKSSQKFLQEINDASLELMFLVASHK